MAPKAPPSPPSSSSSSGSGSSEEEEPTENPTFLSKKRHLPKKPTTTTAAKSAIISAKTEEEDEEEEEDGEDSDSSSDSDHPPAIKPKPKVPATPPPKAAPTGGSESESESESEDDSSPEKKPTPTHRPSRGPDPSIKPISSKPMDSEKRKRKAPEDEAKDVVNGPSGKKLFQRLWSEEDEIAVLKGLIEYQAKHGGAEPSAAADMDAFFESVRKNFHVEVTKTQLHDKIRRLRKKYGTNLRRGKKGADPHFTKTHEQETFELSKKIWAEKKLMSPPMGNGDIGDDMDVENGEGEDDGKKGTQKVGASSIMASPRRARSGPVTPKNVVREDGEDGQARGGISGHKLKEAVAQLESGNAHLLKGSFEKALGLLKPSTLKVLEDKWDRQCLEEMKVIVGRTKFMKELSEALVDAIESVTS